MARLTPSAAPRSSWEYPARLRARANASCKLAMLSSAGGLIQACYGSCYLGASSAAAAADCDIVLDRRVWKELGPDGENAGPAGVVEDVRKLVRETVKSDHPDLKTWLSKRAIVLRFRAELGNGSDPSVDLIVALQ